MRQIYILSLVILLTGCDIQTKFDSEKWKEYQDLEVYPNREAMLRDIIENKRFIGQDYQIVIDSLGQPENYTDINKNELWYPVIIDYGMDIDPVYIKHLTLTMDSDSIVTKVEIREWKQGEN
ncbi:MAG: hypothetical protein JNL53_20240 [Cyclobacteriaceae bacterium]|nr:hypothetical protein [Cyclobacteriaceae bacterium]